MSKPFCLKSLVITERILKGRTAVVIFETLLLPTINSQRK